MLAADQKGLMMTAVAATVGLLIGLLVGHFGTSSITHLEMQKISLLDKLAEDKWESEVDLQKQMINLVNTDNLRNNLKELTRRPHLAATEQDHELAEMVRKRFTEAGFDTAELVPYNILLSQPDPGNPNLITIQNGSDHVVFTSKYKEEALHPDDADPDFVHAFNGYAPAGDVTTDRGIGIVYVNYGRVEDFDRLLEMGVNVSGHIVMARYGKIFRGNKVVHAEAHGAIGMILFSDPRDVAMEGTQELDVYPNTFWLPGSGMQRGTVYIADGDPLTPGWPSKEHAYRLKEEDAGLPKIPCQPIGYNDARIILEKMGGTGPPEEWVGGMEGVAYNLGPEMIEDFKDHTLRLQTHNTRQILKSFNVIGTIKGDIEPDRYVLIGNHRDAWGYGASDPSSGTAQLLETVRVMGEMMKGGWRPRRTIVFCSWGAEEYGLMGSFEWVEEHVGKLQDRAVMYLNTDNCVSGPILQATGSPLVWDAIQKISNMIPGVSNGATLYDEWAAYHAVRNKSFPEMKTLGGGSDYVPFAFYCGIPSLDVSFKYDKNLYDISNYPSYHTGYETFFMVDTHVDPGFRIHQGCSRIVLLTLKYFADSSIIPYSLERLPEAIKQSIKDIKSNGRGDKLLKIYDKFPILEESVDDFIDATSVFVRNLNEMKDIMNPMMIRAVNDQIMKLEQVFILPSGLPGRPETRHAVFAPSQFDSYAASGFPGISDLLYKIDDLEPEELHQREKDIMKHISDLTILVQRATSLLRDFHSI